MAQDIEHAVTPHGEQAPSSTMVIFGAGGDLTKRLLMPALYNLARTGLLPAQFALVGVDRVLYAMDYPYQYAVDEVRILDAMDMSDDVKMKFFQTNAERLFSIPPAK